MASDIRKKTPDDLPASVGLVKAVRNELISEIRSLDARVWARIDSVDAKIDSVGSRVDSLDAKIDSVSSRVDLLDAKIDRLDLNLNSKLDSKFDALVASMSAVESKLDRRIDGLEATLESRWQQYQAGLYRIEVIVEEQRNENRIVLDGLRTVLDRQDRIEAEHRETRDMVVSLSKVVKARDKRSD